jgi:hypothetical protein
MIVKRRRARLLEIPQGNDADAELRKLASIGQRNDVQLCPGFCELGAQGRRISAGRMTLPYNRSWQRYRRRQYDHSEGP